MGTRDPRIDAYIDKSAGFAHPILRHLRELVHETVPDVEETVKWGMPFFMYRGGLFANMAAFKAHATFGFWKGAQVVGDDSRNDEAMGQLGRLTSVKDLPPRKTLVGWMKAAMALRDAPAPAAKKDAAKKDAAKKGAAVKKAPKSPVEVPPSLAAALKKDAKARATFDAFSPSQRREYVDWVAEAKTDATREKRIATTLEWLAEGKQRNWKYQKAR
jgi:hypothetical protein